MVDEDLSCHRASERLGEGPVPVSDRCRDWTSSTGFAQGEAGICGRHSAERAPDGMSSSNNSRRRNFRAAAIADFGSATASAIASLSVGFSSIHSPLSRNRFTGCPRRGVHRPRRGVGGKSDGPCVTAQVESHSGSLCHVSWVPPARLRRCRGARNPLPPTVRIRIRRSGRRSPRPFESANTQPAVGTKVFNAGQSATGFVGTR